MKLAWVGKIYVANFAFNWPVAGIRTLRGSYEKDGLFVALLDFACWIRLHRFTAYRYWYALRPTARHWSGHFATYFFFSRLSSYFLFHWHWWSSKTGANFRAKVGQNSHQFKCYSTFHMKPHCVPRQANRPSEKAYSSGYNFRRYLYWLFYWVSKAVHR